MKQVAGDHARKGELPLSLGGGHSFPARAATSIHGMPLSFFLGIGGIPKADSGPQPFSRIKSILRPEQLDYIVLRNPNNVKKNPLREHDIRAYNMYEVDQYRIGCIVELARA
ncbi:Arginase, catabolizes arginine to ornithine and urea [Ceratobasidium sp. 423]|nr:Arginase, catabolizes arginine to ornithine and urea [Ceratobasidium sp. 423]